MTFQVVSLGGSLALLAGMMIMLFVGRRLGIWRQRTEPNVSVGMIDAALLGLLSLVLAFTFSGASTRFDTRRKLIIDETNAVGTAWLRIDLLPEEWQPVLREDFRRYVDARLEAYAKLPDVAAARRELARARELQKDIWKHAMAALKNQPTAVVLVTNALNTMIDFATTQTMVAQQHPPPVIYFMLVVLSLIGALIIGEATSGMRSAWWLHAVLIASLFALTFFVTVELEHPRVGFIRVDDFDHELAELRHDMG